MKVYETYYMGNRPYCVEVSEHTVEVFEQSWEETNEYWSKDRRVYQSSYERIFIGDNVNQDPTMAPKGRHTGNTILLHLHGSEYVFIGHVLFSFSVFEGDTISEYYSPLSLLTDQPSPLAVGNHIVYQLDKGKMIVMYTKTNHEYPLIMNEIHEWKPPMAANSCV